MAGASLSDHFKNYGLTWALALSALLHALIVSIMPPFEIKTPPPKPTLQVELAPPKPEPPPAEVVTPPEPPKPEPKPEPPPVHRPAPKKPAAEPPPVIAPEPKPAESPRVEPPPPPPVISSAPKVEEPPPAFTAPPEPPQPSGPTEADIESARQAYGNALSRAIGKHKRYPRIAQMRGWEGSVRLLLEIDANGKVTSISVEEASDREVFNTEALEMVKRMVQPPPVPDALRGRSFSVRVPISFRLE